jgi:methyl-accepting chemotaxis protein
MLLRDSDVARRVRTYLLDTEEATRPHQSVAPAGYVSMEQLWADAAVKIGERILAGPIGERFAAMEARQDNVETHLHAVGSSLMELGPVLSRISTRMETIAIRVDAISTRVDAISTGVDGISTRVDGISTRLDGMELRLDSVYEVVGAMSERISDLSEDMKAVKSRIGMTG